MRIVLDTNALLISIPKNSKYRIIFNRFLLKQFTLVISNDILTEYAEIIDQKANAIVSTNIVEMLLSAGNVEKQDVFFKWQLIEVDKDDNKFVDCSIAGNVDFLVTNDRHFDVLKSLDFPQITVINIDEFIELLKFKFL
jgi:putative PIN family toxin of toxin-antitoxin system